MAVEVDGVQILLLTKVYHTENRVPWSVCRVCECLVGILVGGTVGLRAVGCWLRMQVRRLMDRRKEGRSD